MKVAESAFYLEAVPANGIAMRAARNERYVIARRGHSPAEITSHGTRCHDRHPHVTLSARKTFVWGKTPGTFLLRMRPPRRLRHQLHLLAHHHEANPSTKPLFANTAAQCARPSPSSLNFQMCTS